MEWLRLTGSIIRFVQCIGIMAIGLPLTAAANTGHLSNSDCAECHSPGNGVNQQNAHLLTATQEALCGHCHEKTLLVSHPSGFVPDRLLPAEYPLNWRGSFTCSSCHSIHASTTDLLRENAFGQGLCLTCHEAAFFSQMADDGLSIVKIHLTLQPIDPTFPLDTYSLHCTGCHDDVVSITSSEGFNAAIDGGMNHTIGVDYESTASQGRYNGINDLNERMVLPDGYVSCVTCHQGYSSSHGMLNVANTGSALCYQCHDI